MPVKMPWDVGFDTGAAGGVAVLDGSASQAGRQVHGRGGNELGRTRQCTRSLEHQTRLGSEAQIGGRAT